MEAKGTTYISGGEKQKPSPKVDTSTKRRYKRHVDFEPKIEEQKLYHLSLWTVAKKHPTLGLKVVKRFPSKTEADYYANRFGSDYTVVKPASEILKSSLSSSDFQVRIRK